MTSPDKRLAAKLLQIAADEFANHGCNDMDAALLAEFSQADRERLSREFAEVLEAEDCPSDEIEFDLIRDDEWMQFLAAKLLAEADETSEAGQ